MPFMDLIKKAIFEEEPPCPLSPATRRRSSVAFAGTAYVVKDAAGRRCRPQTKIATNAKAAPNDSNLDLRRLTSNPAACFLYLRCPAPLLQ